MVLTKKIAASRDENVFRFELKHAHKNRKLTFSKNEKFHFLVTTPQTKEPEDSGYEIAASCHNSTGYVLKLVNSGTK